MKKVGSLLLGFAIMAPLFAVDGFSVSFEPGEAKGRSVVVAKAVNTSTKEIQAVVFKTSPRSGQGLTGITTQYLGLDDRAKVLSPGEARELRLPIPSGLRPDDLIVSVECVYYADGTAVGPAKDEHAPKIRATILGVLAGQTRDRGK